MYSGNKIDLDKERHVAEEEAERFVPCCVYPVVCTLCVPCCVYPVVCILLLTMLCEPPQNVQIKKETCLCLCPSCLCSYAESVGARHYHTSAKLNKGIEELFLDLCKSKFIL